MFSQLLFVRLRAAEKALQDGRIDEAYRLASALDLREHRRGRKILADLSERFLARAREHYRADRCTEALMDLARAEAGGALGDKIAELRAQVQTVAAELTRKERERRERVRVAKRRIEGGSLAAGRKILEHVGVHDRAAAELREKAIDREADAKSLAKLASELMAQGQFAAAADRIRRAATLDSRQEMVIRMETKLCTRVLANARAALRDGRIGRAGDELACLGNLGDTLPAKRELSDLLSLARQAARAVSANDCAAARNSVLSIRRMMKDAKWVSDAVDKLRRLDDLKAELCAGPLGEALHATLPHPASAIKPASLDETVALQRDAGSLLPDRLLLLVDGGGSFLLLRGGQVSLGRLASNDPADIAISGDIAERQANINRVDDDYFLFSSTMVEVSGRPTKYQLLRDGDRVVLGRKAKFTFRAPSSRSASAVLDLSDTTKMPNDVRRVVLFDQTAMLGAGPTAHIQCRHAGTPLILFEREGALWIRARNDGHVDPSPQRLKLGEPTEVAGVSLVLAPWAMRPPRGVNT